MNEWTRCRVCRKELTYDDLHVFYQGWWYCLEHAPTPEPKIDVGSNQ